VLALVFQAEEASRNGNFKKSSEFEKNIADPFFRKAATLLKIYNALQLNVDRDIINIYLKELGNSDFHIAALEYLSRKWKSQETLAAISTISDEFYQAFTSMKNPVNSSLIT
jgi:thymidylate synthase